MRIGSTGAANGSGSGGGGTGSGVPAFTANLDTDTDPITDSAYTEIEPSTANACTAIEIFNKTGLVLILATGAAASEVDQIFVAPDQLERQLLTIPAGTRLSLKAVSGTADAGIVAINAFV